MIRDLDSTLLRTFITVVETASVSDAAVVLHRTQAAVSMALRRLEEELGRRLLERSPRGVKLTAAGNVLLPYAYKLLDVGLAARAALNAGEISGTVRLGMLEDIAVGHLPHALNLPHALKQFAASFENVALEIVIDGSSTLWQQLAKGKLDIVIGDPTLIHAEPVVRWQHQLRWAAANMRELRFGHGLVPIVAFAGSCPWQDKLFASLREAGIAWKVVCTSTSLSAVQSAVEAGLGIAALLDWSIRRETMRAIDPREFGLPVPPVANFGLFTRVDAKDRTSAAATLQRFLFHALQLGTAAHAEQESGALGEASLPA